MRFLITLLRLLRAWGEIQLTDAIDALISSQGVDVVTLIGDSYDAGDMASYINAFAYFAKQQGY